MPKFYEIHDSLLESIEQDGERVSIRLRAVRAETEKEGQRPSNYLRQEIRIVLDGAQLTIDSTHLPSWLLVGSFRCEASNADPADCGVEGAIPVSLGTATGVELVLSGLYEGSGEFVTISVEAKSLTIERLGDPQSLQYTRASI
jgi:hypothetical protein